MWIVIWRMRFTTLETVFGLMGLAMIVVVVAVVQLHPSWSQLWHHASHPSVPSGEGHPTYFYYAIALFGAAMTPYEVFFFSSGAVEEKWTRSDLVLNRANVYLGFPLGGILSLGLMAGAALVFHPLGVGVDNLSQVALPTSIALGKVGSRVHHRRLRGVHLRRRARDRALVRLHRCRSTSAGSGASSCGPGRRHGSTSSCSCPCSSRWSIGVTAVDPIKVTEYSIVLSAAALPLTYFPILVVANDRTYMGDDVNGPVKNAIATFYMVVLTVVALATIPLMIATKAGS